MNVSYYRGLPASVWRTALQRPCQPATGAAGAAIAPAGACTAAPAAAPALGVVFQGLARAA